MSAKNTTVGSIQNITASTNGSLTTSTGSNTTIGNPWLFSTPITPNATFAPTGTIIITSDFWYWESIYYFYMLLLLFIGFGLIAAGVARKKRKEAEQRARVRAQGNGNTCTPPNDPACTGTAMPDFDNPPTYENVMANYINAKEQLRAMEEGGAMAMSASTTTIETCVTEVASSHTDLNANSTGATATSSETPRPALQC